MVADDLNSLPPSDLENAINMDYDTKIDGDIPDSADQALRENVLRLTKIEAVDQINDMLDIVDQVGRQVVINSVAGEELKTKAPLGVKMIMSK